MDCEAARVTDGLPDRRTGRQEAEGVMFNLGWTEVVIILLVAVVIFGPKKIPELGNTFGKTLRGFKEGMTQANDQQSSDRETGD